MKLVLLVDCDYPSLLALNHLAPTLEQFDHAIFYTQKPAAKKHSNPLLQALANFNRHAISDTRLSNFDQFNAERMNDVNGADFARLRDQRGDLIISIRHMSILRERVIHSAPHGVINLHSGLLPQYQGVMATFWAMRDGQPQIGTTLHRIEDPSIDTGAIIKGSHTPVNYQKSYLWNVLNLYKSGCENIAATVQCMVDGEPIVSRPQQGPAHYFSYPSKADLKSVDFELFETSDLVFFNP